MTDRPLVVPTCSLSGRARALRPLGIGGLAAGALLGALVGLGLLPSSWLAPALALGGVGVLLGALFLLCRLRSPAFVFDGASRAIRVRGGGAGRTLGGFDDYKGIDLVAEVREDLLADGALHEMHRTYPDPHLLIYEVQLVGEGDPVPILRLDGRAEARALQDRIVRYCGWTHRGSSVPDSRRSLPA